MKEHGPEIAQIAAEANVSKRAVRSYLDGGKVLPVVEDAIKQAAKSLHMDLAPLRRKP